jgi:hypothetical protein
MMYHLLSSNQGRIAVTKQQATPSANTPNPEELRGLLQHAPLGAAQTIIVARGPQALAYRGALREVEAADVAVFVHNEWREGGQTLRVQFMPVSHSPNSRLVLVYPLSDAYRLILVDNENAPLGPLRKLSVQLLSVLEVAGIGRKPL